MDGTRIDSPVEENDLIKNILKQTVNYYYVWYNTTMFHESLEICNWKIAHADCPTLSVFKEFLHSSPGVV